MRPGPRARRILTGMPVSLHHIVVDAHDLPGLARFWAQALRWRVLSEREREVVIGPDESALVGMCFMPVPDTERKTVKNRLHLDLTTVAEDRDAEIDRLIARGASTSDRPARSRGRYSRTRRATSSVWCVRSARSSGEADAPAGRAQLWSIR